MSSTTRSRVYTTKFRRDAKRLQLERQMMIGNVDVGRIHRQFSRPAVCGFFGKVDDGTEIMDPKE